MASEQTDITNAPTDQDFWGAPGTAGDPQSPGLVVAEHSVWDGVVLEPVLPTDR